MMRKNLAADIAFAVWLALVAAAFWGPFVGLPVPADLGSRVYALFLVAALAVLALTAVRRKENSEPERTVQQRQSGNSRPGKAGNK
ncbi:MAG: hypothetical protein OHK0029_18800 [Armatimonadaceae bacterium]